MFISGRFLFLLKMHALLINHCSAKIKKLENNEITGTNQLLPRTTVFRKNADLTPGLICSIPIYRMHTCDRSSNSRCYSSQCNMLVIGHAY